MPAASPYAPRAPDGGGGHDPLAPWIHACPVCVSCTLIPANNSRIVSCRVQPTCTRIVH